MIWNDFLCVGGSAKTLVGVAGVKLGGKGSGPGCRVEVGAVRRFVGLMRLGDKQKWVVI